MLAAMAVTGVMALQIGAIGRWGATVDVTVPFEDAAGLTQGAEVGVAGVKVGSVARMELNGDRAIVHVSLDADAGLGRAARAPIGRRSLLGEKYVEIEPGSAEAALLQDGDELAAVGPQVEIDELVQVLGPLLGALDPEVVAGVTSSLAEALREDPERVARMLDHLETLSANAAEASEALPGLATDARETLRQTRAMLATVDARATQAAGVLDRTDRALAKLEQASEPLPETIDEARAALGDARQLLGWLDGATGDLEGVLDALSTFERGAIETMLRDDGIRVRFTKRRERDR